MLNLDLKKMALNAEVDSLFMKQALKDYANPRAKITALLRSKEIIRVKKGLYLLNNPHKLFVKETLANLIYGPSYISLEYALAFYGFIPERVEMITSVTNKKDKLFKTPIGEFSYRFLNPGKYSIGITQIMYDSTHPILIATPEKALADKITLASPSLSIQDFKELESFLFENLRIYPDKIFSLNKQLFNKISIILKNKNVEFLNKYLNLRRKK